MQPTHFAVGRPLREQRKHLQHIAIRPGVGIGGEIAAAQAETGVQLHRHRFAIELLFEALQQAVADPANQRSAAIKALHHLFHAQAFRVVGKAQPLGQGLLVIETQAFFRPVGDQVQAVAQAREFFAFAPQCGRFVHADMAQPDQRFQILDPERTQRHPAQRLQVAQAARAVLDVRFQVVGGVAEALMPRV